LAALRPPFLALVARALAAANPAFFARATRCAFESAAADFLPPALPSFAKYRLKTLSFPMLFSYF
jgi:hypothetical protein